MEAKLATTNVLLGIMAVVSVLEALAVIGFFLGGFLLYKRLLRVLAGIEERQVAPVATSVELLREISRRGKNPQTLRPKSCIDR